MAWSRYHFHLIILSVVTLLAGGSLALLTISTEPTTAGFWIFICLYLALFVIVFGLSMLTGLYIRQRYVRTLYAVNSQHALRQALLVSILIVASLFLSSFGYLRWWSELLLIGTVIILELFLVSRR